MLRTLFVLIQLSSCLSVAADDKFANIRSYVADRLELVASDWVLIDGDRRLFSNGSIIETMHVNDANPEELLVQGREVNGTRIFCVMNRKTTLTVCYEVERFITINDEDTLTLAAYIDSTDDDEPKIAGCYETYGIYSTLTCFVGKEEIGKWEHLHLSTLRYLPKDVNRSNATVEAIVVTDYPYVIFFVTKNKKFLNILSTDLGLTGAKFLTKNRIALATNTGEVKMEIYVCNLSLDRLHINCTAIYRYPSLYRQGLLGFVETDEASPTDYAFLAVEIDVIFDSENTIYIGNYEFGKSDNYLFDRHKLIALSNDGHLCYITAGYRKSADNHSMYAVGSLQAVRGQSKIINFPSSFHCNRFSTNGINIVNDSFICTNSTDIDNVTLIVFNTDNHLINTTFQVSATAILCEVAAVDQQNQVLAYCCTMKNVTVMCQSNGDQTNHSNIADFDVGYDFDTEKITVVLYTIIRDINRRRQSVYIFVEGKSSTKALLPIGNVSVIGVKINAYNSILISVHDDESSYESFYACAISDVSSGNATCRLILTRIRQFMLAPQTSHNRRSFYTFDFNSTIGDQMNLIGWNVDWWFNRIFGYITIEAANEILIIGNDQWPIGLNQYCAYVNMQDRNFNIFLQANVVTLTCLDGALFVVLKLTITYNETVSLIDGYIPAEQDDCSHNQADGGGADCPPTRLTRRTTTMTISIATSTVTVTSQTGIDTISTTIIVPTMSKTNATKTITAIDEQHSMSIDANTNNMVTASTEMVNYKLLFVRLVGVLAIVGPSIIIIAIIYRHRERLFRRRTRNNNITQSNIAEGQQSIEMRPIRRMIARRQNRISDYGQNTVPVANVETRRHDTIEGYDDYM